MNAIEALEQHDSQYRESLQDIGRAIGYGNAQSILGELWDNMLYHFAPYIPVLNGGALRRKVATD